MVSVIIPAYNSAKFIGDALRSVFEQTFRDFEVIVIDDGSTDNLKEALSPYLGKIRYLYQENKGVAAARNIGINQAVGEIIALLDADDIWFPEKMQLQIDAMRLNRDIGFGFTNFKMFDESGVILESGCLKPLEEWYMKRRNNDGEVALGNIQGELLLHGNLLHTSTVAIKREVFKEVGFFDGQFRTCEDFDLWMRIARKYRGVYIHRILCGYRVQGEGLSGRKDERRLRWAEDHAKVYQKHWREKWIPSQYKRMNRWHIGEIYFNIGLQYFKRKANSTARWHFIQGLKWAPNNYWNGIYCLATFMPKGLIDIGIEIQKKRKYWLRKKKLVKQGG